jgi:general stress protein 26
MTMPVEQGSMERLRKMIKNVKYALLTTSAQDGTLHSRPLTTLDWEFDGVAWFLVARQSRLADEVGAIPEVNLAYASPEDDTFVSLAGRAEVQQNPTRAKELWNRWAEMFFPDGPGSPEVGVLRVDVRSAEYWTGPDDIIEKVAGATKALVQKDPSGLGHHARIEFQRAP